MTDEERDDKLNAVYIAVLGIPGTDNKGMSGDMKDLRKSVTESLKSICDNHDKLKSVVYGLIWFLTGTGILAGTGIGISKLIGG